MKFVPNLLAICLGMVIGGCSHYHGALPLPEAARDDLRGGLAVVGVLDRRLPESSTAAVSLSATRLLVTAAKASDLSDRVNADEVAFLLSSPAKLLVESTRLQELRRRLGHRYAVVGEQGSTVVTYLLMWDAVWVIPLPFVAVVFTTPFQMSNDPAAQRATRVLRVVDLETASIVGESYEVLRDSSGDGEFTGREFASGLTAMRVSAADVGN